MLKRLVKKLTNNIGLKILALLFSVAMWMAVVNISDPTISKPFTVAVTIENENAIASMNKYYEIANESTYVTFNVLGKRSIVQELSSSDFKAVADMSQLIQGKDKNIVRVEITALRYTSKLTISKRVQEIEVNLEDLMSTTLVIQAGTQGKPAEGYALGTMEVTPNLLKVSGPKEVVSQIDTVKAIVDISGMSMSVSDGVVPVLLDENEKAIDTTRLTLNLKTVTVKVNIVSEKTVPVKASYRGRPASGFEVISVKTDPAEVTIKGRSEILNAINSITIPENVISVDNVDEKFEQQVDLTKYLPEGVSLSNSKEASVIVKVDVEELERRVFTIPAGNISVDNLPEGFQIKFSDETVDMVIYGLKNDLDELSINEIRPILDVAGKVAGSHVGQLMLTLDAKYIVGDTTVSYTITSNNRPDPGQEPDDTTGDEGENNGNGQDSSPDDDQDNAGDNEPDDEDDDSTPAGSGNVTDTDTDTRGNDDSRSDQYQSE